MTLKLVHMQRVPYATLYRTRARSHGGGEGGEGGEGGGSAPPGKSWAPLGCLPWHFIGIGIEVYLPPGILSAPPPC